MKKQGSLGFMMGLSIAIIVAFTTSQSSNALAEVERAEGLYLFHQAKPTNPYKVLGNIQLSDFVSWNKNYFLGCESSLIRKAKKHYPEAEGLIIGVDGYQAEVIQFKY